MQRVNTTACEAGAVAVLVERPVPLVGRLEPQAAISRARAVVVMPTAAVRHRGVIRVGAMTGTVV